MNNPEIQADYKFRPVRFIELYRHEDWHIKIYSISSLHDVVEPHWVSRAKENLTTWLKHSSTYPLLTYQSATLILHEGKEGCFAIICWWIDENMLQLFVYLATYSEPDNFVLFSDKGMVTCVWEMAVLWFERNAWVQHVLMKADAPDMGAYFNTVLNDNV